MDLLKGLITKEGAWAAICITMIFWQNQRLTTLEDWVRDEVITVITANTIALTNFEAGNKIHANKENKYSH